MTEARTHSWAQSVQTTDELKKAIQAADERAALVYAQGTRTLVDEIPAHLWATWDASGELALVADCLDPAEINLLDEDSERVEAA